MSTSEPGASEPGAQAALSTSEPEMSPDVSRRRHSLRTGWTTGTCASAAAKAATEALVNQTTPKTIEVSIPNGARVAFEVESARITSGDTGAPRSARAVVVKDAGDDPDCTDGAHMTAEVRFAPDDRSPTVLLAGDGVGTVTKPGLGLAPGSPAINPVPRRMILAAIEEVTSRPVVVTFEVPGGVEMARRTTNARLGILGGISILGTTGIVRPFSTAAYRASVVQQIDVAAAQGERILAASTGSRSEAAAMRMFCDLDAVCFVEVGDFSGIALRRACRDGIHTVHLVAMVGKIAKLASGVMMTHFHRSRVDTELLAEVARASGASQAVQRAATETETARHFFEACEQAGELAPLEALCRMARRNCEAHALSEPISGREAWNTLRATSAAPEHPDAMPGRKLHAVGAEQSDPAEAPPHPAMQVPVWMVDFSGERVVAHA